MYGPTTFKDFQRGPNKIQNFAKMNQRVHKDFLDKDDPKNSKDFLMTLEGQQNIPNSPAMIA